MGTIVHNAIVVTGAEGISAAADMARAASVRQRLTPTIPEQLMDKKTRRERLRSALAGRQIRTEDHSYISQLLSGKASFGEKAARRLERDYLLPAMSLDQPFDFPLADNVTKDALIARIFARLQSMHIEKLKALAIFIEA